MAEKKEQPERQYRIRGNEIAARMKERGLSIAALADRLDVNVSTVRRWLQGGRAYMRNIEALGKVLELPTHNLMEGFEPHDRIQIHIKVYWPPGLAAPARAREAFLAALSELINASDGINALDVTEE